MRVLSHWSLVGQIVILLTVSACSTGKKVLSKQTLVPMQWVPAGSFVMGSPSNEVGRRPEEGPVTKVTISKGFWMGKTEVTIGQWKALMGESLRDHVMKMLQDETTYEFGNQKKKLREFMNFNPNDPDRIMANENDNLPMYFVSWNDAMDFCKKLNAEEKSKGRLPRGYEYTLPTEAQWEYACRAGTTDPTYAPLNDIAWYMQTSVINYSGKKLGNSGAGPRNAGEKNPNAWGLHDMLGNLWEWCRDWYETYPGGEVIDPVGATSGNGRVNRGGSWGSGANSERSASRASNPPAEKSAYRGFRVALCILEK